MNTKSEIVQILKECESIVDFTTASILDVGCGMGNLVQYLSKTFPKAKVFGIEPSQAVLDKAVESSTELKDVLKSGSGEKIPFDDETFDLLIFQKSFHHCNDFKKTLLECSRVLKLKGKVVFVEPVLCKENEFGSLFHSFHNESEVQSKAYEAIKTGTESIKMMEFEKLFKNVKTFENFVSILDMPYFKDRKEKVLPKVTELALEYCKKKGVELGDLELTTVLRLNISEKV